MALCLGLPGWAGTREAKPIWILLKQREGKWQWHSGISWAICNSALRSRQITMPAPHHSVFYRPDALPVAQPTVSKHWRQQSATTSKLNGIQQFATSLITMRIHMAHRMSVTCHQLEMTFPKVQSAHVQFRHMTNVSVYISSKYILFLQRLFPYLLSEALTDSAWWQETAKFTNMHLPASKWLNPCHLATMQWQQVKQLTATSVVRK